MQLTDANILGVIRDLKNRGAPLRGVAIRRELFTRYSCRASTDRVYRLLRQVREERAADPTLEQIKQQLSEAKQQAARALERAELAEAREQAHFDKWAGEIYELRKKVEMHESLGSARLMARMEQEKLNLQRDRVRLEQRVGRLLTVLEQHGLKEPDEPEGPIP